MCVCVGLCLCVSACVCVCVCVNLCVLSQQQKSHSCAIDTAQLLNIADSVLTVRFADSTLRWLCCKRRGECATQDWAWQHQGGVKENENISDVIRWIWSTDEFEVMVVRSNILIWNILFRNILFWLAAIQNKIRDEFEVMVVSKRICSILLPDDMRASVGGSAHAPTRTEGPKGDTLMGLGRAHTKVVCRAQERSLSLSEALNAKKNARYPLSTTRVG